MSLDLNNLKEQIQTIFQTANTTTATQDLSSGLESRVQRILKVNPARIPIQATWYPFVTVYIDRKEVELTDFCKDKLTARRQATVDIKVIGAVWNSSITDDEVDPGDEDCEDLMENIEQVLRANPTLVGSVTWSKPTSVTYHNAELDEGVHIRAGIMNLEALIFY
jgi:hypothetical protein